VLDETDLLRVLADFLENQEPCSLVVLAPDPHPALAEDSAAASSLRLAVQERCQNYLGDRDVFACLERRQYAIFLPARSMTYGFELAEAIRQKVEQQVFPANAQRPRPQNLTISLGVVEGSLGQDAADLLRQARNALEEARTSGNCSWSG